MPGQKDLRFFVLAGPIGSGKSTVGKLLAVKGAAVIDSDRIGHAVIEPEGEAFTGVAARWPDVVRDGRVDRARLAAIVFGRADELAALEALTHPHIVARVRAMAEQAARDVVVVEVPLTKDLLGAEWHRLVVLALDDVRLERAVARGMAEEDVLSRMAAQAPYDVWEAGADSTIVNDGDRAALGRSVEAWWRRFVSHD